MNNFNAETQFITCKYYQVDINIYIYIKYI